MTKDIFDFPKNFVSQKRKTHIQIQVIKNEDLKAWLKKQSQDIRSAAAEHGFDKEESIILVIRDTKGRAKKIIARMGQKPGFYDMARVVSKLEIHFSYDFLKSASFEITGLKGQDLQNACISWGLAAYAFNAYKKDERKEHPCLLLPKDADKKRIKTFVESILILRNLVNTPANDLGPDELEAAAKKIAKDHEAKVAVTRGEKLEKDFPLIHTVGMGSDRKPRLIDIKWGNAKHPKVTLVGKGVCFDTGGLNLKPTQYMALMKKDMGGAAHVLALANMIMTLKLPVRLRVLIPAVENSVSGNAFRPGDIIKSRSGITVENTNTDAEGRLIVADALTYASEEKPDLIIDYCTLTGSARAALGPDIPAAFSNDDKTGKKLQDLSFKEEDPVWIMPLWQPYKKYIDSPNADLLNSASAPGDLIYSALFLEKFLKGKPNWVHMDIFSWEQSGRPGRPKGAADTGLRSAFALLEDLYGK